MTRHLDPDTDLVIERRMTARPETVWRCWTDPALFVEWFAPKPVKVSDVAYDFHPGGRANLTMTLPDGTVMPLKGCVVDVEPARRLVTTDAMTAGFRPAPDPFMTAIMTLEPDGSGTLYRATVLHHSAEQKRTHEEMGFWDGWGTVIRQLDELSAGLEDG